MYNRYNKMLYQRRCNYWFIFISFTIFPHNLDRETYRHLVEIEPIMVVIAVKICTIAPNGPVFNSIKIFTVSAYV